jgi:catechol 2,3-dioxygenase-like lactoylglutathione lyase family enzyme
MRREGNAAPPPAQSLGFSLARSCLNAFLTSQRDVLKPPQNNRGKITGINHLTLAVSDLKRSVAFYSETLGFAVRMHGPSSAYLEAGGLWLALVVDPEVRRGPLAEYSHAAFTVAATDLPMLVEQLNLAGTNRWQESDRPDSVYFLDPDGHKLELHSGDLNSRLQARDVQSA